MGKVSAYFKYIYEKRILFPTCLSLSGTEKAQFEGILHRYFTIFFDNVRCRKLFFKSGLKDLQVTEIADKEAVFSCTDQIQPEMVPKALNYLGFVTLWKFLCQDKRENTTM